MNVTADQVRAATRGAAAVITADSIPPLRLDELAGRAGLGEEETGRHRRRARPGWFTPLVAAAAVIIVVVGSVAVGSRLARSGGSQPSGPGQVAGPYASVPPYYVEIPDASSAVVRATATGSVLAKITTSTPFVGVTGAADDRTFVLDAQRQVMGPTVTWPGHPQFYLLKLSASGAEESFTRLAIPAPPTGTAVTGLALSPDASKLAVEVNSGDYGHPGLMEIRVYTLAAGGFRAWSTHGSIAPEDSGGFTGSGVDGSENISWAANSRTLAFHWSSGDRAEVGVRLLDTTASGNDLIADSRLATVESDLRPVGRHGTVSQFPPEDHVSECVTDSIMSLDGSSVVCGYATTVGQVQNGFVSASSSTTGFLRYSTSTGKPSVLSVFTFRGESGGDITLYWVNSTGKILIGGVGTPRGIQIGVINGETFTPLPGIAALGAAAW